MSARGKGPGPTDALRSLAQLQLQTQVALAATMDARAIGVMGVDAALAAIVVSARFGSAPRIAAMAMLLASASLAGRLVFLENEERIGPPVARLLASRAFYDDHTLDETILDGLVRDVKANERMLARGARRLAMAFVLLVLAALLILIGSLY